MRKLIADSGSTKTDWVKIIENDDSIPKFEAYSCRGLNPHFLSSEEIETELENVSNALGDSFDHIDFYGAGVGNPEMASVIKKCISHKFDCPMVRVDSDMAGAAQAVLGSTPGIACIMGTGSNSCHYDGCEIDRKTTSLGYIYDDCGGGVSFGRRLLGDIYKGMAPSDIEESFCQRYGLTVADVLDHTYRHPSANKWIAGFMPFIIEHRSNPYIADLIKTQIQLFFDREFHSYADNELKEEGIGFVGSVAYMLLDEISEELKSRGWKLRRILRKPLDNLTNETENK